MSLISTASPWTNDDISTKKRTPSLARKTIKLKPYETNQTKDYEEYRQYQASSAATAAASEVGHSTSVSQEQNAYTVENIEDVQRANEDRNQKVNDLINQMTSLSEENDGAKLADFNPPPKPSIQMKKDVQTGWVKPDEPIQPLENPLQMPAPSFSNRSVNPYIVNNANISSLGNYQQVYDPSKIEYKPYYAKMGISSNPTDGKMMEKINYMIHLLENQENEKTANITEEFILYTFLGVFIIFVIDSFSKNGKYVR